MADLDSRCDCSLGRRYTVCMGRVPLLRQLCCSQPCSIPAGACTGRVFGLYDAVSCYTCPWATMQFPAWCHTTCRCMQRESMGFIEQRIVTCSLATSQFQAWCHKTSRCMQREGVGCTERCPFLGPQTANSPTPNKQVHAKVCRVIPILITPVAHSPAANQQVSAKGQLKLYTTMSFYPSLSHLAVNSLALHKPQVYVSMICYLS